MNQRTARLLRRFAEANGQKPKAVRRAWAELSWKERTRHRRSMQTALARAEKEAAAKAQAPAAAPAAKAPAKPAAKPPAKKPAASKKS